MILLADASPLIHLTRLGRLDLLPALFGDVRVTEAVLQEVTGHGAQPGASEVAAAGFLLVEIPAAVAGEVARLRRSLHIGLGEAATIAAARELPDAVVLMDDHRAREAARAAGIRCIGTLRVMEIAFERRLIPDLAAEYRTVLRLGIRIPPKLLDASLARHGLPPLGNAG